MRDGPPNTDYLAEVREQVCGCCPERAAGIMSRCGCCQVRQKLPQLVQWIHDRWEQVDEFVADGTITGRLVWAVKTVDERREQHAIVRRRIRPLASPPRVPIREMIQAYEEATGICLGCD